MEAPYPPTSNELGTAEEGGVEIGGGTAAEPNEVPLVQITQNIRSVKGRQGCNQKKKPPQKKGHVLKCVDGHWTYESEKHAAKKKQKENHHKVTGGGPPRKRHNKTHKHGKRRKHKVVHSGH